MYFHVAVTNFYVVPVGTCGSEVLQTFSLSIKVSRVFPTLRVHKSRSPGRRDD